VIGGTTSLTLLNQHINLWYNTNIKEKKNQKKWGGQRPPLAPPCTSATVCVSQNMREAHQLSHLPLHTPPKEHCIIGEIVIS